MMVAIFATCWLLPLSSFSIHGVPHYHTMEDWRGAISFVNQQDRRDWPVFLRAGLIEDRDLRTEQATDQLKQYCLFPLQTIYPLAVADEQLFALPSQQSWEITANEIEAIEEAGGAWVFVRGAAATAELIGARWVEWLTPRSKSSLTVKRHEFGLLSVLELNAVND